jgi:hypothetical protein
LTGIGQECLTTISLKIETRLLKNLISYTHDNLRSKNVSFSITTKYSRQVLCCLGNLSVKLR